MKWIEALKGLRTSFLSFGPIQGSRHNRKEPSDTVSAAEGSSAAIPLRRTREPWQNGVKNLPACSSSDIDRLHSTLSHGSPIQSGIVDLCFRGNRHFFTSFFSHRPFSSRCPPAESSVEDRKRWLLSSCTESRNSPFTEAVTQVTACSTEQ